MAKGLLFDVEYCTGCFACTVACKQENGYDANTWGIKILEQIYTYPNGHVQVDNVPFPTNLCTMCAKRISSGFDDKPSCVKHCTTGIIYYGEEFELLVKSKELKRPMLYMNNKKNKSGSE